MLNQAEGDELLKECPVGFILRTTPHIYDALDMLAHHESMGPLEVTHMTPWFRLMLRLYRSELSRLRELRDMDNKVNSDIAYAERMRSGG